MRIQKIHIENFGKLHDFDMELENGLNAICSGNGWGKTTLAAFIKAMLYGLDYTTKRSLKENERRRYFPWQGGAFGGSMEFETGGQLYRVERFFGAKDKDDRFVLYDLETGLPSDRYSERLGEELFRLDRAAYERSCFFAQQDFAVSVNDSLHAGLTHAEEDAGDMQNYEKAMLSLEDRMKYFQKTGGRGRIGKLQEQRRQVKETLAECRQKELAAAQWQEWMNQKLQQEKDVLSQIQVLERKEQIIRDYEVKAAKKSQHDLLKSQAVQAEEQLRMTAAELAEYVNVPPAEDELDRCREQFYRVNTMRMQEEFSEDQVQHAKRDTEASLIRGEVLKSQKPYLLSLILAILLMAAGGVMFVLKQQILCVVLLPAGVLFLIAALVKSNQHRGEVGIWEKEHAKVVVEQEKAEADYRELEKKRKKTEERICQFLQVEEGTEFKELESRWKLMRGSTHQYMLLKQTYESQRLEAQRRRKAYLDYWNSCPETEWETILNVPKPAESRDMLSARLSEHRRQRDELLKELQDMRNRLQLLKERAEQIPELLEEEERLSQEIDASVREHDLLEKTMHYLKTARDQFSIRYLKDLQKGLEYYVEQLVPETKNAPVVDVKLKVRLQEAGAARELETLSAGWQDLLQIAERFAIVDSLFQAEKPVLILDDPFVNLDDEKQKRAMGLLEEMAHSRQMIYFTCRS